MLSRARDSITAFALHTIRMMLITKFPTSLTPNTPLPPIPLIIAHHKQAGCIYTCTTHTHTNTHSQTHKHTYTHVYKYPHIYTITYTHTYKHPSTNTTHTHTYTHTHTHTHTHRSTHTLTNARMATGIIEINI